MITTRQLIFIINIVLFFVNPVISGDRDNRSTSSSQHGEAGPYRAADRFILGISQCFRFLFHENESTDDENTNKEDINEEDSEEDKIQHLEFCQYELHVAFKKKNPLDNFLYAFLYLKNAEFLKNRSIYTYAAAEYYYELLCIAYEMNKPYLMNPHDFCENRYGNDEGECLRSIEEIGCDAYVDGITCVRNLYFNLNLDEFLENHCLKPVSGTEKISDEDLEKAITRGFEKYPNISSILELFDRFSDTNIAKDYYRELIMSGDPRRAFHKYDSSYEFPFKDHRRAYDPFFNDLRREHDLFYDSDEENRRMYESSGASSSRTSRTHCRNRRSRHINPIRMYDLDGNVVREGYYLPEARYSFYGINKPFDKLYDEQTRRERILRMFGYQYIMYLHEQLRQSESSQFKDSKEFCTTFLLNYPKYYLYLKYSA